MDYIFSKHSLERLDERQIPIEVANEIISKPDEVIESHDGLTIFQGIKTFHGGKNYLVRIYVNTKVDPSIVVTAFRTTKIEKYKK
ncbi:MAG: DUF4258 domain-containing protein [Saprospiraceae bacterium]|nr:DUF4258 domain-containing protein [Saprospiraceae bacterium]MCF8249681.1 DUF4258 domain-containing protein [Saprospiraceae bacterium]MCF8279840.1 DUF4258 domain-containing protein [Bacteroidales bacterium]MCF8312332.1 DUF4258 domain-containing protein [Saprospiraceae bacterium]MCF8440671.1 DUF4258 domain-containing protein [Saprospiraceae bacterium]